MRLRDDRMGACRVATLLVDFGKRLIFLLLFVKLLDDMLAFELVLIGVDSSAGELLLRLRDRHESYLVGCMGHALPKPLLATILV